MAGSGQLFATLRMMSSIPSIRTLSHQTPVFFHLSISGQMPHSSSSSIELRLPSTAFFHVQPQLRIDHAETSALEDLRKRPQENRDSGA